MRARLRVEAGPSAGTERILEPGERLVIGRSAGVDLRLADRKVGRRHAAIELRGDALVVIDLESRNGTYLGGRRLPAGEDVALGALREELRLGSSRLTLELLVEESLSGLVDPERPLAEQFEDFEELGRGGVGRVVAATHRASGQRVAIKVLFNKLAGAQDQERFRREAQLRLRSPHVIQVLDVAIEDDLPHLFLELAPGGSLQDLLRAGPLPLEVLLRRGAEAAEGLACAHRVGIVHRDLKPANLLVGAEGRTKLADFGLAKELDNVQTVTLTGVGLGTISYVSPEQAQDAKRVAPAADVYSLGATLYHLLTGRPPYLGSDADLLEQIFAGDPQDPRELRPDCPDALARLLLRALETDPDDRPHSASVLARALQRIELEQ